MKCDRCGAIDRVTERISARGMQLDLCVDECGPAVLEPWIEKAVEQVGRVPELPRPTRERPFPRPPMHGFSAGAIEAAQTPTVAEVEAAQAADADRRAEK